MRLNFRGDDVDIKFSVFPGIQISSHIQTHMHMHRVKLYSSHTEYKLLTLQREKYFTSRPITKCIYFHEGCYSKYSM